MRFKKPKKRRVSQTEDGDEAYERSENAIVHVPKSLVNAIAKKIHNQVMGDVLLLQKMCSCTGFLWENRARTRFSQRKPVHEHIFSKTG